MRAVPAGAARFTSGFEGWEANAYPDPASPLGREKQKPLAKRVVGWERLSGEPWTIGYGHTGGVKPGDKVDKAMALMLLVEDLKAAARRIYKRIGDVVYDLTENQYIALLDFTFNLGDGNPKKPEWTIWKLLRARKFDQIPGELNRFVNAGSPAKKMNGLVRRRAEEVKLWAVDEPGSTEDELPSSVTRATPTPPTPIDPVAPQKSGTIIAAATSAVASAPLAISEVRQQIEPFKDDSAVVSNVYAGLATVAALLAILVLVLAWMKKRSQR